MVLTGLITSMGYGGTDSSVSMSMHDNRWCWSASGPVVLPSVIPPNRDAGQGWDGAAIGRPLLGMVMTKKTFAVTLIFPVVFILLRNDRTQTFLITVLAALFGLWVVTVSYTHLTLPTKRIV